MASGFIDKLPGGINVVHKPADVQFGDVDFDSPPKGCGHTTQTTHLPSYKEGQREAPTFTVGKDTVWQHRGLGKTCGTLENDPGGLETNRSIRIQFELIGFSTRKLWLPKSSFQREALSAIKQLAREELDVPPDHVWPDKQEDGVVLATADYARRHSKFPNVAGWYAHVEIPENAHWDWGSLRWDDLEDSAMVEALAFVERFKTPSGQRRTREISPFFASKAALRDWAVVPDDPNREDNEDELRRSLFAALCENRVWVVERLVPEEEVVA